ncbi:HD domain-containing phosphohydrolase [Pseudodesulfovibrio sp. zrk46]|uniref:HD domain-containing phosphohydrolase n=1 Tax=Pseudodesulfovibrio sp. zrk46 TaxID=2725288 RepID=UPI00144957E3|nr:HD domain-containing phosphohydrolase [Pseudodesulfovibrio sp. zrk46]QJB55515.1 response regulator [Pseudodesulfovibrio sp. zrk46]
MSIPILFVDDSDAELKKLECKLPVKCRMLLAGSYAKAVALLKEHKECPVVIAELGLGGENGLDFLEYVRRKHPRTMRIILSKRESFEDAVAAMNSDVFRYLTKPCEPKALADAVTQAMRRRRDEGGQRKTLLGSIRAMVDILDMVNPVAMGFAKRIRPMVVDAGNTLGVSPMWHLEMAVLLSHIGCVALPEEIVAKVADNEPLSPEEKQIFGMHPAIASNLLENIPGLEPVAGIIAHQHDTVNDDQPLEARIIKVALDVDHYDRGGHDPVDVLLKMEDKDTKYDSRVVEAMLDNLRKKGVYIESKQVAVEELREGMIIARDLVNKDGTTLLLRGHAVSKASLTRLQRFHVALGVVDPIHVAESG